MENRVFWKGRERERALTLSVKVLSTSHVYAHTGMGADFTHIQKCSLWAIHQALGKKTGKDLTDKDWDDVRMTMGTLQTCNPMP